MTVTTHERIEPWELPVIRHYFESPARVATKLGKILALRLLTELELRMDGGTSANGGTERTDAGQETKGNP